MTVTVAIPTERRPAERRVALDPTTVERLLGEGFAVRIEAGCGAAAGFMTDDYAGVAVFPSFAETVAGADVVVKVSPPTLAEVAELPEGVVLITLMSAFQHRKEVRALLERGVTTLAMDLIPRITRAQAMDALSSQSTVAGYKAALLAAQLSPRLFPMLTTAAGSIRPSNVVVIGAGVAGLQAIATARRLGAQVEAYDIRSAAREQIESLGARMIDTGVEAEGIGGYARGLKKSEKQKQNDVLAEHVSRAHVLICAAAIPGRRAPRIVTAEMVDRMMIDTVIVDMAADTGGNCELTRPGEHYRYHRTLIAGPINLPSHGAFHATEMYARNVASTLALCVNDEGALFLDPDDDIIAGCVLTHEGRLCHAPTATLLSLPAFTFGDMSVQNTTAETPPDDAVGWLKEPSERAHQMSEQQTLSAASDGHDSGDRETRPRAESDVRGDTDLPAARVDSTIETDRTHRTGDVIFPESARSDAIASVTAADGGSSETDAPEVPVDLEQTALEEGIPDLQRLDGFETIEETSSEEMTSMPESFDELTRIDGIGPAMQGRLYAFGVTRLDQLAQLDQNSARRLTDQLELEDNRILEDDWPAQARRLLQESEQ